MRTTILGGLTVALALGCGGALGEPVPDVAAAKTETHGSVTFQVPGNWTATSEAEPGIRNTTVESGGNALLMVQEFDEAVGIDANAYADMLRGEYQTQVQELGGGTVDFTQGAVSPVTRDWFGAPHTGATVPVTLGVLGVVVPHTLEVYTREVNGHTLVVFTQVAVEDAATVQPGFDLVLRTMAAK